MKTDVMFSRASDNWETPVAFYLALDHEFHFGLDAAATRQNRKFPNYLGPDHDVPVCRDALTASWRTVGAVWLNCPYSKCRQFIAKAREESLKGATVVCLVPSRTDTKWWHEYVYYGDGMWWPGVDVRFIKGRLKFGDGKNSAPFPSVLVIFKPVNQG